jgi:hypothetical protein
MRHRSDNRANEYDRWGLSGSGSGCNHPQVGLSGKLPCPGWPNGEEHRHRQVLTENRIIERESSNAA